jgi:hypothetical protein
MAASYPTIIKSFTYKVDNQDKVVASDVNSAYDEIVAIENQLGIQVAQRGSGWGSAPINTTTLDWTSSGGLKARVDNIENGIYSLVTAIDGGTP